MYFENFLNAEFIARLIEFFTSEAHVERNDFTDAWKLDSSNNKSQTIVFTGIYKWFQSRWSDGLKKEEGRN